MKQKVTAISKELLVFMLNLRLTAVRFHRSGGKVRKSKGRLSMVVSVVSQINSAAHAVKKTTAKIDSPLQQGGYSRC